MAAGLFTDNKTESFQDSDQFARLYLWQTKRQGFNWQREYLQWPISALAQEENLPHLPLELPSNPIWRPWHFLLFLQKSHPESYSRAKMAQMQHSRLRPLFQK